MRPPDTLVIDEALAVHEVGATWETFANATAGTVIEFPSGVHDAASEGMLTVVGVTPHVASPLRVSVKLPFAQEPPPPEHEQEQLGVPSPLITRRSVATVSEGHVCCEDDVKSTAVQPAGTFWQEQPVVPPPSPVEPSPVVAASGPPKVRSGSELHATSVNAASAIRGRFRPGTAGA
jgi:hypothetical protein